MAGSGFSGIYTEGTYADYSTIKVLPNPGHLRVMVTPTEATVDYISSTSTSGTVNYSYTIEPNDIQEDPPGVTWMGLSPVGLLTGSTASLSYTRPVQVSTA